MPDTEIQGEAQAQLTVESVAELQRTANEARAAYEYEVAIVHYTQALKLLRMGGPEPDFVTEYDLLARRAECYEQWGDFTSAEADLAMMVDLTKATNDLTRKIEVLYRRAALMNRLGQATEAQQAASAAVALARDVGDRKQEADSLTALGRAWEQLSEYSQSQQCFEQALGLYRELGDRQGEARCLWGVGASFNFTNRAAQAREHLLSALALYRELNDRAGEANMLNLLAQTTTDYAQMRAYYEAALAIFQDIGNRERQGVVLNNLGWIYWSLGLYSQACYYGEQAAQIARDLKASYTLSFTLDSLGRAYLGLGADDQAQQVFEEGRALAVEISDRRLEAYYWLGLGRVALDRQQLDEARELLQRASNLFGELDIPADQAVALAWLGLVCLDLADWPAAHRFTSKAIEVLTTAGDTNPEFPPQDVWWLHYQILQSPHRNDEATSSALDDSSWSYLDRACQTMLSGIASLSDEGLRRNYLNKVQINRAIVAEWTRQAARRDLAPPPDGIAGPPAAGLDRIQDQLKRMLAISVRLNQRRDPARLLDFIMDELVELSGAERGFLALFSDDSETRQWDIAVARGFDSAEQLGWVKTQAKAILADMAKSKQPILWQDVTEADLHPVGPGQNIEPAPLRLRSVLGIPLVLHSQLIGILYADNRIINGRFLSADIDLLTVLATQATVAIENSRLLEETLRANRELEQRVAERTVELQIAAETLRGQNEYLAALHETTLGLISRLDLNDLLEALITRAGQLLGTPHGYIYLVEAITGLHSNGEKNQDRVREAELERKVGVGVYSQSLGFRLKAGEGLAGRVWQSGQPLVINNYDTWSGRLSNISYDVVIRALMGAPLKSGSQVVGVIGIGYDTEIGRTFGKNEVELLNRFAELASIALDNARLYTTAQQARITSETANRELSRTLDHLRTTQNQLVEAEKMAALGGLVAGVAHEINTPVGIGVTAASLLENKTTDFREIYSSGKMKRSDLEKYLDTAEQSSRMLLKNLNRAAELIQSFKQVAVDQSSEEKRIFTLKAYLEEILISLRPTLKRTQHAIEINGDDSLRLDSYPGAFSQIVTNLVMNSLMHAYKPDEWGRLTFDFKQEKGRIIFEYADNGHGIPKENLSKIFDPFFTTKRGQGGSGLGLHIIYNLVTQKLGGTIRCESEVDKGTKFIIEVLT